MTQNRKQTFGDKRIDQFPGEEKRYEVHIWAYPEIPRKREKWQKNTACYKIQRKKKKE